MRALTDKLLGSNSTWSRQLLVACLYVLLGQCIHHYLLRNGTVSALWPGSGLLLGAMLLGGRRYVWGALLGSLTFNFIANDSWLVIIGITVANMAELLLAFWLLRCKQLARGCIDNLSNYLRFIALGGGLGCLVGALLGSLSLLAAGMLSRADYFANFVHWWMGDTLGLVIITPLMLAWQEAGIGKLSKRQKWEAILFSLVIILLGQIVFVGWLSESLSATPKEYWIFLAVVWAAMRFGARGSTALVLLLAAQALYGAYRGVGFFAHDLGQAQLENYWAYMIIASIIGMTVSSYITARKQSEQELQQQNEKYLVLLRNASDGIHILDRQGDVIEASDAFCAMLGYSRAEILQMNVADWDVHFSPDSLRNNICARFEQHIRTELETRHKRKDGTVIDVEISGYTLELEGELVLFNSSRDITERKRIAAALQQQLQFSGALNRIAEMLVKQDDPELILQHTVQIVGEMLEADRTLIYDVSFATQQVIGLSEWLNPRYPDTKHSKGTYPLARFSSGAQHLQRIRTWFTSHSENMNYHLQADGSGEFLHHTMNIRSLLWYPFAYTSQGFYALVINQIYSHKDWNMAEIDFLDSVSHIVSLELEKIRLTKQRKEAEARLRIAAIAFESQEGMMITDANKRLLQVNRAFTTITGYTQEDVLGQTPRMLSSGRHGADFYRDMWDTIAQTGVWEGEIWNKRKNGEIYPEHLTITAVKDETGAVSNYVGALTDSTQREQVMEQLRNSASELARANAQIEEERSQLAQRVEERTAQLMYANKAKDSFLATMSHEIRTPLGGMLGMMELLALSQLGEEQTEMLKVAHHSGKSLLRIVDDILDWSKIEAGKLELAPSATAIVDVLKSVTDTYAQLASGKDVLLEQHIDPMLGHCI